MSFYENFIFIMLPLTALNDSSAVLGEGRRGDAGAGAHLAVAGEGGVVKQEVGTEEEDDGVEHPQARPVQEDGPAEEGVLGDVPERDGRRDGRVIAGKHA